MVCNHSALCTPVYDTFSPVVHESRIQRYIPHLHPRRSAMPKLYKNIKVIRDIKARQAVKDNEVVRRAYLYVARNQNLPPQVRFQAQLQLNTFSRHTAPSSVKARCTESGRGRGIITEFGLSRVRSRRIVLNFYFLIR